MSGVSRGYYLADGRATRLNRRVDKEKIILLRNFFWRGFLIALVIAILMFVATMLLWNMAAAWVNHLFGLDEKEMGRLVLAFFLDVRLILLFFFLTPALALHWTARKM
jgi:cell division protein FtsX